MILTINNLNHFQDKNYKLSLVIIEIVAFAIGKCPLFNHNF